jgi:hypothetical protein
VLVADRSMKASAIPDSHYRTFHRRGYVPATAAVWIGAYAGPMDPADSSPVCSVGFQPYEGHIGAQRTELRLYSIHVGHCLFEVAHVVQPENLAMGDVEAVGGVADHLIRIWPGSGSGAVWPRAAFTAASYVEFLNSRWLSG